MSTDATTPFGEKGAVRRHVVKGGGRPCWCGSGHDWSLAKHGWCECTDPRCREVHRA